MSYPTAIIVCPDITFNGVYIIEENEKELVVTDSLESDQGIAIPKNWINQMIRSPNAI